MDAQESMEDFCQSDLRKVLKKIDFTTHLDTD
jgi:hypothetical protein